MSFHEKSAAAMLVIFLAVYGLYFAKVFVGASAGPVAIGDVAPWLFSMIVLLVVLGAGAHIVIAALAPKSDGEAADAGDERDRLIQLRSDSKGGAVLAIGVLATLGLTLLEASLFVIAHVLLGALALSEIVNLVFRLIYYRRTV